MTAISPIPDGACDCHIHVYEDSWPLAAGATFKPPHAPLSVYRQVQRALGRTRAVLVQPTGYGFDNSLMLQALQQMGDSARGIAVLPPGVDDGELQRLHTSGVRGVRFMMIAGNGGALPWDALPGMAERIAPLGWHINLQLDGRELPQRRALIDDLPGKVVIDHTGKFLEPVPPSDPAFKALLGVLEGEQRWVKLAAPYETSKLGPPHYADVALLAQALLRAHPDRCVWASNWPHPSRVPAPDNAHLLGLLGDWAGDELVWQRVLVDNAVAAFDFRSAECARQNTSSA
jgi:D-galactarolactone isomerase